MALQEDNTLNTEIFDYMIIPSSVHPEEVRFGIQTHSTHPRFSKIFFRTRRPIEEFTDLCEFIASRHPNLILPALPFHEALPDEPEEELTRKRLELHQFSQVFFQIPDVFDDACIPLFLQSHLVMDKIKRAIARQEAGIDEEVEESNPPQVAANNPPQVAANNPPQVAAGNVQQVLGDRDQPHDGENDDSGNSSDSETDEPMFHMEDI